MGPTIRSRGIYQLLYFCGKKGRGHQLFSGAQDPFINKKGKPGNDQGAADDVKYVLPGEGERCLPFEKLQHTLAMNAPPRPAGMATSITPKKIEPDKWLTSGYPR
jgi:hypothetical protein